MNIKKLLQNDNAVRVLSLIIAVFTWIFVVVVVNPNTEAVVKDIPIQINLSGTSAERFGLEIVSDEILLANVTVTGDRTVIGSLNSDDVEVSAVLTGISEPGTYSDIQLQVRKSSVGKSFEIETCSPSTITLKFDRKTTKTLPVSLELNDLTVADGYMLEQVITSPTSITVTGPENDVIKVAGCIVRGNVSGEITASTVITSDIILIDSEGKEIDNQHLTLSVDSVDITIPVLKRKTLPVEFTYVNVPDGFDTESIKYMLSNDVIEIAGPETLVNQWNSINVGYIDLSELDSTREYEFDIVLPSSFVNVKNITTLIARFVLNDYETDTFTVSNIKLENIPENYDVSVNTQKISKVTIVGPADVISKMTKDELVAKIDMSQIDVNKGQYKVPVSIYSTTNNNVWVIGEYSVVLNVTEK